MENSEVQLKTEAKMLPNPRSDKYIEATKRKFLQAIGRPELSKKAQQTPWEALNSVFDLFPKAKPSEKVNLLVQLGITLTALQSQVQRLSKDLFTGARMVEQSGAIQAFKKQVAIAYNKKDPIAFQNACSEYNARVKTPLWEYVVPELSKSPDRHADAGRLSNLLYAVKHIIGEMEGEIKVPEQPKVREMTTHYTEQLDVVFHQCEKELAGTVLEPDITSVIGAFAPICSKLETITQSGTPHDKQAFRNNDFANFHQKVSELIDKLRTFTPVAGGPTMESEAEYIYRLMYILKSLITRI